MRQALISDTLIRKQYTVRKEDLNGYGLMHGGRLLTLADEVGYLSAHGYCRRDCLTVAVYQARFHQPAHEENQLSFQAQVALTGRTSLWTPVHVTGADGCLIMEAIVVYAAVDKQMKTIGIPTIQAESRAERKLQAHMEQLRGAMHSWRKSWIQP